MCVMNIKIKHIYNYIYIYLGNIQRPHSSPSPKMMVINKGNHPLLWPNYSA